MQFLKVRLHMSLHNKRLANHTSSNAEISVAQIELTVFSKSAVI